jgi:hypothetical protein
MSGSKSSNAMKVMNKDLERFWKEAVVVCSIHHSRFCLMGSCKTTKTNSGEMPMGTCRGLLSLATA